METDQSVPPPTPTPNPLRLCGVDWYATNSRGSVQKFWEGPGREGGEDTLGEDLLQIR